MPKKVLIIEDDSDISELMEIVVKNEGYSVDVFQDLDNIEKEITKHKPDLIIMDLTIGSTDSTIYVKKLKKNKLTMHIPIIIVSAKTSLQEAYIHTKADAYLAKPFDIKDLVGMIKKLA